MTISLGTGVVQPVDLCYNPINERVYTANRLTYNLTVIKDSLTTIGISSPTIENSFIKIYPNPVDHVLYLNEKLSFSVYSSNGQLMYQQAESTANLDVSNLTPGLYLLVTDKGVIRFVKKWQKHSLQQHLPKSGDSVVKSSFVLLSKFVLGWQWSALKSPPSGSCKTLCTIIERPKRNKI